MARLTHRLVSLAFGLCLATGASAATIGVVAPKNGPYAMLGAQILDGARAAAGEDTLVEVEESCEQGSGKQIAQKLKDGQGQHCRWLSVRGNPVRNSADPQGCRHCCADRFGALENPDGGFAALRLAVLPAGACRWWRRARSSPIRSSPNGRRNPSHWSMTARSTAATS